LLDFSTDESSVSKAPYKVGTGMLLARQLKRNAAASFWSRSFPSRGMCFNQCPGPRMSCGWLEASNTTKICFRFHAAGESRGHCTSSAGPPQCCTYVNLHRHVRIQSLPTLKYEPLRQISFVRVLDMPSLKNKNENHCGVVVSLTISSVPAMSITLQKRKNGKT
jgi:hypothetical protein